MELVLFILIAIIFGFVIFLTLDLYKIVFFKSFYRPEPKYKINLTIDKNHTNYHDNGDLY